MQVLLIVYINNIIPIYIFGKNYHHLFIRNLPYKNRIYVRKTIDKYKRMFYTYHQKSKKTYLTIQTVLATPLNQISLLTTYTQIQCQKWLEFEAQNA